MSDGLLPEALAWLQRSVDSKSPSTAQVYAEILLKDREQLLDRIRQLESAHTVDQSRMLCIGCGTDHPYGACL